MAARNVGEWSEIYAVARLLTNEVSYSLTGSVRGIIRAKVQHSIAEPAVEYVVSGQTISVNQGNEESFQLDRKEISRLASELLSDMRVKSERTFQSDAGVRLVKLLGFGGASAVLRDDVKVVFTTTKPTEWKGVSIKSFIGAKPTLLNASSATNFVYKLIGPQDSLRKVSKLNRITMKPLFDFFRENHIDLAFSSMDNRMFSKSLQSFSPDLESLIAQMLRDAAFQPKKKLKDVWGLTSKSGKGEVLVVDAGLQRFLGAVAFGLQPATLWVPRGNAFGGFLNINPDGNAELFGETNMDVLGARLFEALKFEWGSRTRHKFGIPFKSGSEFMIKLNLQLRYG
jgi:type II restriction enzyme